MPWLSIISFIITFLLSSKEGASTSEAALTAAAVGGLTYLGADPANPNNFLGFDEDTPIIGALAPGQAVPDGTGLNADIPSSGSVNSGGSFGLPDWLLPATVGGVVASGSSSLLPFLLLGGAAVVLVLVT